MVQAVFKTNTQMNVEEETAANLVDSAQRKPVVLTLAAYVMTCWEAARTAKQRIEFKELQLKQMLKGEYDAETLTKIRKQGGSEIFMGLADEKSEAAKAWLTDTMLPIEEEPFGVAPSPIPDLPPGQMEAIISEETQKANQDIALGIPVGLSEVIDRVRLIQGDIQESLKQSARKVERAVENKIRDVIVESNWRETLETFIGYLVDRKAAFLVGPVFRMKRKAVWGQGGMPEVQTILSMEFDAPDPFDVYPSPSSKSTDDGYILQKHILRRKSLVEMKGAPGYDSKAIDEVLKKYGDKGFKKWLYETNETERDRLSNRYDVELDPEGTIDALQFKGCIQGMKLIEHGVSPAKMDDLFAEYEAEVWIIGEYVIKAVLNENPMGGRNIWSTSYRKKEGQIWGKSVPELVEDSARMCNAAARGIVDNMGITSGPQVGVDTSALPDGETLTNITPMKIWQFKMGRVQNGTRPPIWFFQPKNVVNELIKVYEFYSNQADNQTGIPRYAYGQEGGGGALSTATGMSMMMNNATKGIKRVVKNIDQVIVGSIEAVRYYLMFYYQDPAVLMGDVQVVARGTSSLVAKEQLQLRRNEFLQIAAGSPYVMEILKREGFSEILRGTVQGLNLKATEDIIPSREDMRREDMIKGQMMIQGGAQSPPGPGPQVTPDGRREGGADAQLV